MVQLCAERGVTRAVIAPGSRNTPLTLAFTSQEGVTCYSVTDERSAAFFALGMSQYTRQPVALICTSGTAALNFAPAIAEAYYQHLPLIVMTADRPSEWIDQSDGQTIRQHGLYANYIKADFQLPSEHPTDNTRYSDRIVAQALDIAMQFPEGPVHFNLPLDEPLYVPVPPKHSQPKLIRTLSVDQQLSWDAMELFQQAWHLAERKMIIVGMGQPDDRLKSMLLHLAQRSDILLIAENISNIADEAIVSTPDLFFAALNAEEQSAFQPDLLITIGDSVVSKQLKQFLRKHPPKQQWQTGAPLPYADTYNSLNYIVPGHPAALLELIPEVDPVSVLQIKKQQVMERIAIQRNSFVKSAPFSDLKVTGTLLTLLPESAMVQISNSTPIRLSQLFESRNDLIYFCNRGTSGIDGSVSTSVGAALVADRTTVFISGDLSFIYDSNGLWNRYLPAAWKAIVFNNGGANIFRLIGDNELTAPVQDFFDAPHDVDIASLVAAFGVQHKRCASEKELKAAITWLLEADSASVLEIKTDMATNISVYKEFFSKIKSNA